jgi:hypothetical protein
MRKLYRRGRSVRLLKYEFHRYFPEWADRPTRDGVAREAERNSYLAGGYAEEFGYLACPDSQLAFRALPRDPERSLLWRAQIGAVHPGYPECPTPLARFERADEATHAARASVERLQLPEPGRTRSQGGFVRVRGPDQQAPDRGTGGLWLRLRELRIRRRELGSPFW